jgi:hypothetical protein
MYKTLRRGRIVIGVSNQATQEPSVSDPAAPQLQRVATAGNGMIV